MIRKPKMKNATTFFAINPGSYNAMLNTTSKKPIWFDVIKEYHQKLIDKLFGQNNFFFTVIMNENEIKKGDDYANVLNIIKNNAPINAVCNLVVLTNNISLGCHCYIGLNSYISNGCMQNLRSKNSIMIVN